MPDPTLLSHSHPVYRVAKPYWVDPLDTSYSERVGGRWNPPEAFPMLYTCCSEDVARQVVRDLFTGGLLKLRDLQPEERPELVEIGWEGEVIDVVTAAGIAAAGFPATYPHGIGFMQTQPKGTEWHARGFEGVLCRSASLDRAGASHWDSDHVNYAEVAIFVRNCTVQPQLMARREFAE